MLAYRGVGGHFVDQNFRNPYFEALFLHENRVLFSRTNLAVVLQGKTRGFLGDFGFCNGLRR
jgi:hypothetical protein